MDKVVKMLPLEESDRADFEYYAGLTPQERLNILIDLVTSQGTLIGTIKRLIRIRPIAESEEG